MDQETQRQWYLLTSKPFKDSEAELQLCNQKYEVYRPLARRLRKRRGKMITSVESLFPRYLFIHLDDGLEDNWAPIRSTRGVQGFVRFGLNPALVPDELITVLRNQEEELGERAIDLDRFHNGDDVMIMDGPYKGLNAVFQSYDGDERAIVLLNLLHCETRLPISPAQLCSNA